MISLIKIAAGVRISILKMLNINKLQPVMQPLPVNPGLRFNGNKN